MTDADEFNAGHAANAEHLRHREALDAAADEAKSEAAVEALKLVIGKMSEFLETEAIPDFLVTEHFNLGGRTALHALFDGDVKEVLALLEALETCAYT